MNTDKTKPLLFTTRLKLKKNHQKQLFFGAPKEHVSKYKILDLINDQHSTLMYKKHPTLMYKV